MPPVPPIAPDKLQKAIQLLKHAKYAVAFTGAGISVESNVAPFRGPGGLWEKYDSEKFHKRYFVAHPQQSWELIRKLFYEVVGKAQPNPAHLALAELERSGPLNAVITQNIDNLHTVAGSEVVFEYHGTMGILDCLDCRRKCATESVSLKNVPPPCPNCGGLLKPDIVFFGEPIPETAHRGATEAALGCDVMLVIGTTGEVQPAARLPFLAKNNGAAIIEINIQPSAFTDTITDVFLQGKAGATLTALKEGVLER